VKNFLKTIRVPVAIVILNGLVGLTIGELLPQTLGDIIFNAVRIGAWCYAGWLVVAIGDRGIWKASFAGLVLFGTPPEARSLSSTVHIALFRPSFSGRSTGRVVFNGLLAAMSIGASRLVLRRRYNYSFKPTSPHGPG
jgi:hypothetical protein